jgi:hypothetical protein
LSRSKPTTSRRKKKAAERPSRRRAALPAPIVAHAEAILVAVGVVVTAVLHALFVTHGFGEADIARLAVAAGEWHDTGRVLYTSYIFRTSPLYIQGLKLLLDLGVPVATLPALLNGASVVLASLTLIPLYLFWRKLAGRGVSAVATILFAVTPAYSLAAIYGMAHLPSFALFVVSLLTFVNALGKSGRPYALRMTGAFILAALAIGLKADMVLCFGAYLGAAVYLRALDRRTVVLAAAMPFVALIPTIVDARLIASALGGIGHFATSWSGQFPFTVQSITDDDNRSVLFNSVGRGLFALGVLAALYCVIRRRHGRALLLVGLWGVPPVLFWGLRMGNSARHMMAAESAFVFLIAVALASLLPKRRLVPAVLVVVFIAVNYGLGPAKGGSISPTPRLDALSREVQRRADLLRKGAEAFAAFPVPAKVFVGSAATPYAVFAVMARAVELSSSPSDALVDSLGLDPTRLWPVFDVTLDDSTSFRMAVKEVAGQCEMKSVDDWFLFSFENDITVFNSPQKWRPYLRAAIAEHPEAVEVWAHGESLLLEAAFLLSDMQRYKEALTLFERLLVIRPDSPEALFATAQLYLYFGRRSEAQVLARHFLRLYPTDARAQTLRKQLETLR